MIGIDMRRLFVTFAFTAAAVWVLADYVEIDLRLRDGGVAHAQWFGSSDEEEPTASDAPLWHDGSGQPPIAPQGVPGSFADLAERVSPAVVSIYTETARVPQTRRRFHPFEEFLPIPRMPRGGGVGSGFVIRGDGLIATNEHVIRNAEEIRVEFADGSKHPARIIGVDKKTDIALIQVETGEELTVIPFGDSDAVRPGDWVLAIGNPFDLEQTVTAGIVSAKHRSLAGTYDDYIQTDAAINPGSSGGPLLNLSGEVIGINTAIREGANTVGFTIPINMAKQLIPQLYGQGHVTRGWLGVVIQELSPELADQFDVKDESGALVNEVAPGGPAQQAGVRRGDVIVEFEGEKIESWNELPRVVAGSPVGQEVDIVVMRGGKRKSIGVTLGELPGESFTPASAPASSELGLQLQPLTQELADRLELEGARGVLVSQVEPGSPAEEAGLQQRDVILEVNQESVDSPEDVRAQVSEGDSSVLFLVQRGERTQFFVVKREG
jgi:serine protease Do